MAAAFIILVFALVVGLLQTTHPEMEIGDASLFLLAAAAVGAVTIFTMQALTPRA